MKWQTNVMGHRIRHNAYACHRRERVVTVVASAAGTIVRIADEFGYRNNFIHELGSELR